MHKGCELCEGVGGTLLHRAPHWRVVEAGGEDGQRFPGFCRVIWNAHVREMSDLAPAAQVEFMAAVFAVEAALRASLAPVKMNLASLGNLTPHLHWHVIPRLPGDPLFPKPIWSAPADSQAGTGLATLDASVGHPAWRDAVRRAAEAVAPQRT